MKNEIAALAGIAGLFHDIGKANDLFQLGLKGKAPGFQPRRHEWISLRLFAAFVDQRPDGKWLKELASGAMPDLLSRINEISDINPFPRLPPIARAIGWLIVSHHRIPVFRGDNEPGLAEIDRWQQDQFTRGWGYENEDDAFTAKQKSALHTYSHGLTTNAPRWQRLARQLGKRALKCSRLAEAATSRYTLHLARCALMFADHYVSSLPEVRPPEAGLWANTNDDGELKQSLEYHICGVTSAAYLIGRNLHRADSFMPAISDHQLLAEPTQNPKFEWQNIAFNAVRDANPAGGFFGVNLASTGCGKTFANARIMYALNPEKCRFNVALGLRTLTLQTGDALKEKLALHYRDLAVAVGGSGVRQLHRMRSGRGKWLFNDEIYVKYDGQLAAAGLQKLAGTDFMLPRLLSAPVLVSTIDHLMPATESLRGGRQIAPILRLLTSDLVLDEPDDFDVDDQHALCRLVNFAGMLGSRVLLSSATLPPSLVQALYSAYRAGRQIWSAATGGDASVLAGWFDEFGSEVTACDEEKAFAQLHQQFARARIENIRSGKVLRRAEVLPLDGNGIEAVAAFIREQSLTLHERHHQLHNDKRVSVGLVRFANIKPLIAVAQLLMSMPAPDGVNFRFCVYHSQHPLLMRSHIESRLDAMLTRYDETALFSQPEMKEALRLPGKDLVCIVLATSVAEVGRDHDYDWAIAEPSSMRSLIQLAGRIQRHRQKPPTTPNMVIMSKNIRALQGGNLPPYSQPGFETRAFKLPSHDLREITKPEDFDVISSIPRLQPCGSKFADLEHYRTAVELFGSKNGQRFYNAALWWRVDADWSGELQRRKPFRASTSAEMTLYIDPDGRFFVEDEDETLKESSDVLPGELEIAEGNGILFAADYQQLFDALQKRLGIESEEVSRRFGQITLRVEGDKSFHMFLGIY
ncbi:type I-F CRISPR-associated helicase Cas3 [Salmonella enterica subsp. enterica serovar Nigeria]|nr:type I-F CRISPR-associated helicase Cas3 [Salmonella enterica subsp. enterica serovar Nigeria]